MKNKKEMYKIELEDGSELLSEKHKVYVEEENGDYNNLNSFINSSVVNILISDCSLNASSSDQIEVLFNNKDSAKYGSSSTPLRCGDILLASERNLEYLDFSNVLTDFFNKGNKKSNSDSSISENFIILPFLSNISFNTRSGDISSHSVFNNSSITYLLTDSDLKNENNTDASTISDFGRAILTHSSCCLATFCFTSLESFEICSSVNLLLDNISLAIENSTLLTSCFNTLAKANSNSLLNSVGISILMQNSSSMNMLKKRDYIKLSDFNLIKISEIYNNLENNNLENKQLVFLDEQGREIK